METMEATRTKLCWNCEGHVPIQEQNCVFCGVYIGGGDESGSSFDTSVPNPPYQTATVAQAETPESPYNIENQEVETGEVSQGMISQEVKETLFPLSFLLAGSIFLLFGVALALFSHEGIFTLQWDGTLWYVYLLLSLPLLALGWRSLHYLEDSD